MTRKRSAVFLTFASTVGVGVAYGSAFLTSGPPAFAVPLMITSIATWMIAVMVMGAVRDRRAARLELAFAAAWLIVVAGFLLAHFLPPESVAQPHLFLGVPRRAAIVLYGVGLLPLLTMPIAYALTFDDATLSDEDLARVREKAAEIIAAEQSNT